MEIYANHDLNRESDIAEAMKGAGAERYLWSRW